MSIWPFAICYLLKRLRVLPDTSWLPQATSMSEEERLGIDFGQLWVQRQKADVKKAVAAAEKPAEHAEPVRFDANYATTCVQRDLHRL